MAAANRLPARRLLEEANSPRLKRWNLSSSRTAHYRQAIAAGAKIDRIRLRVARDVRLPDAQRRELRLE